MTAVEVFEFEKTTETITRYLTFTKGDEVGACSTMAAEDLLGKVTLRVSIDGVKQKPIRYTIIK